jgi:hypothetical protein
MKRRNFLLFLGASAGTVALSGIPTQGKPFSSSVTAKTVAQRSFPSVKLPLPLEIDNLSPSDQTQVYSNFEVVDDLIVPDGFTYDLIAAWGDKVGDSRFGYNNDYVSFVETAPNEGFLTVNFEYISGKAWMENYEEVVGKSLPLEEVKTIAAKSDGKINAFALPENSTLKNQIKEISKEGLIDQGLGVISIRQNRDGSWQRTYSNADRRITGISGLEDDRALYATGPAIAVFTKGNKMGYEDNQGNRIIGTFQNCAGGTTPWGTVLSAEENFQDQVFEPVMADGSAFDPGNTPFILTDGTVDGRANVFGLPGNKYGWMVEVDPANPNDYGKKHTWLGRFRHEAVGVRAVPNRQLAFYSGCDRRGGHLYKFVSQDTVKNVTDKSNSRLLENGMLYGAKFNPDGSGRWVALTPDTPVDPVRPSQVFGNKVILPNPNRAEGGLVEITDDAEAEAFKSKFKTLGDLYMGNKTEKQGAILIDAHFAGNAAGISCTARPEDTDVSQDGTLYIAFTSGRPGGDGGPDQEVFAGPDGEAYEFGWIMKLQESNNDPSAMDFRWEMFALGGEPAEGGLGFVNPDNLDIDPDGDVWMVTDISTSKHNLEISEREGVGQSALRGIFGNNSAWYLPTSGANAGMAYPIAIGPMECEICGIWFTRDQRTLFLAPQHVGAANGKRQNMASETRTFAMKTTTGELFMQQRQVPLGSNWPGLRPNDPPRPGVVAVRRQDNRPLKG